MTRPWWQWALGWLGLAAHLGTLVFYISSGLLAPGWAVAVLLVVWVALLVVAIRLPRSGRPLSVLLIPIVAWLIWFGALTAGERFLGWTG
jgi:tryptophan-rich sensory protein